MELNSIEEFYVLSNTSDSGLILTDDKTLTVNEDLDVFDILGSEWEEAVRDVFIKGNLNVDGNLYLSGYLTVEGNVRIYGDLVTEGSIEVRGDSLIAENVSSDGPIWVEGEITVFGDLESQDTINAKSIQAEICKSSQIISDETIATVLLGDGPSHLGSTISDKVVHGSGTLEIEDGSIGLLSSSGHIILHQESTISRISSESLKAYQTLNAGTMAVDRRVEATNLIVDEIYCNEIWAQSVEAGIADVNSISSEIISVERGSIGAVYVEPEGLSVSPDVSIISYRDTNGEKWST